MYKLLLFSGGVYKFDEFKEFIEDIGGIIVKIDSFEINRGMYFLSEEIKVILLVPSMDYDDIFSLAKNIKGNLEEIDMGSTDKEKVILIFEIYKNLKINESLDLKELIHLIKNNQDFISINGFKIDKKFFHDEMGYCKEFSKNQEKCEYNTIKDIIKELLDIMEKMKLIEKRKKETLWKYKLTEN